jgi:hypothetical protein
MWRLTSCSDQGAHPFLASTNGHKGRQVWVFDENAGSAAERNEVERLRAEFAKARLVQKHSSDELLRLQQRSNLKVTFSAFGSFVHFLISPAA